ncbi:TadE/TadG family type IV pilus assembly protein [Pseudomonas sp. 6D_7.1_Bac1]|jgi:Flp pilus assembly protein TadG|uniref:TadE/TadG family type IV pilus assembly protein n=1 Tax=Pseudomonas sp. 6D_7.1_Bac1 TaxID=2971615 RepID=UPI0021C7B80C|nr:TadE/TadG family type IV pilus assembly protein [Pseudomonas sp. 6D_7.1_Bac1]MCU1751449.1 pilus assembly protein [Pseudomonas sp. 6D_7.1_Bac1]
MKSGLPRKQKGAVAIEFALVFVIFFAVFYGIVSYSVPLLLVQSFNEATAEAVRQSVALDPNTANYPQAVQDLANAVLKQQLSWVPSAFNITYGVDTTAAYNAGTGLLTVSVAYPTSKLNQVIPFLVLPGVGSVPNLPTNLTAQSSLQF